MDSTFLSHLSSAAMVIYALQSLKRMGWYQRFAAWMPVDSAWVHRTVSVMGAFLTSVGLDLAIEGNAGVGWHLALTIPPLMTIGHALLDLGNQFALNQLGYDLVAKKAGISNHV